MTKKVLVVEDDPNIVDLLEIHLKDLGCTVVKAMDGEEGLREALGGSFDLVVLDLMLPKLDGLEVCRRIRAKEMHLPILMLTARTEEIDKVLGLEMGADDYLTKPFGVREFIARVKAIFRRMEMLRASPSKHPAASTMQYGALQIDLDLRRVALGERRVELSPKEFDLLNVLASNPGKSYNRSKLLDLVWGYEFEGYEHTVNSHINRLRSKIELDIHNPTFILTTWGVGYRFNEEL
ncbi:MAG: response regulator transcription factor [Saprospiraceae bacterium]|nr:response regulator transcription factor [Saprospiraceae bacterium]